MEQVNLLEILKIIMLSSHKISKLYSNSEMKKHKIEVFTTV